MLASELWILVVGQHFLNEGVPLVHVSCGQTGSVPLGVYFSPCFLCVINDLKSYMDWTEIQ